MSSLTLHSAQTQMRMRLLQRALARPQVHARIGRSGVLGMARHSSTAPSPAAAEIEKIVPGGPILPGTVNDPTPFPPPSPTHGSHHWSFERLLSATLVPLTAAAFVNSPGAAGHAVLDGVLGLVLVVHCHVGFDASITDYIHTRKFPILGEAAKWGLRGATLAALGGVYAFNTGDVGLTELIARVWTA